MTSLPYICSIFLSGSRGIFTNVLLADKMILVVLLSFSSSFRTEKMSLTVSIAVKKRERVQKDTFLQISGQTV